MKITTPTFTSCRVVASLLMVALLLPVPSRAQTLIHRYSFTTDASDSVGGADGTLMGDAYVTNGSVILDGVVPTYVNLPADLVTNLTNYTFETWLSWNGGAIWQRIFDFGNSTTGQGIQGAATASACMTPSDGSQLGAFLYPPGGAFALVNGANILSTNFLHQIDWTYDYPSQTATLYIDGQVVNVNTNQLHSLPDLGPTENDWIGHSQFYGDPDFVGAISEFRIYDGALSAAAVVSNYISGPDMSGRGPIQDIRLLANSPMRAEAFQQLEVAADFLNVSNLEFTTDPTLIYHLSDTNLFSVSSNGLLTSLGTNSGSVTVTATYQGQSVSQTIQVLAFSVPVLIHRYSFTSDASDSVGNANGTLEGDAVCSNGAVILDGSAYVQLPPNFVTNLTSTTFEFWLTWNGGGIWQHIFDFGDNDGGNGNGFGGAFHDINLVAEDGNAATDGGGHLALVLINGQGVEAELSASPLSTGVEHHVVWAYDAPSTTAELYVDGTLQAFNIDMTNTFANFDDSPNCWLGQSQYGPVQDPDFRGSIDEFRIYNGAFSIQQAAFDYANGPNVVGYPITLSASVTGGQLIISWPVANSSGFTLQSSPTLGKNATWSAAGSPTVVNGQNQVTITINGGAQTAFYRLKQ